MFQLKALFSRHFKCLFLLLLCAALQTSITALAAPTIAVQEPRVVSSVKSSRNLDAGLIRSEVERAIQATRRFDVLTREGADLDAIAMEGDIEANRHGSSGDVGTPISAEFVAIPTVNKFSFYSRFRKIPNIDGKYQRTDLGVLELHVQVIESRSGRIRGNFNVSDSFNVDAGVVLNNRGAPAASRFARMASNVASKFSGKLIDTVFPMLVVGVGDGLVYLNRGEGSGVKEGDVYKVFRPGEDLIDPYSGESLGAVETHVGDVRVVRVNPKTSQAKIIKETSAGAIAKLDIVRSD